MCDVDDACHCFFSIRMLIFVFSGSDVPLACFESVCMKRGQIYLDFSSSNETIFFYNNSASSGII